MCGGGAPKDNSAEVASIEATAAREAREAAAQKDAAAKQEFEGKLGGAYTTGMDSARQYFASRGLNPDDYIGAITSAANNARSAVPMLDSSPGSYFNDLGSQVYTAQQDAKRAQQLRAINSMFGQDYAQTRVGNDLDDASIEAILGESQGTAETYVKNLLDRGVITSSGYNAALKNVQGQKATANSRLSEIGGGLLEKGRKSINEIINGGRSTASGLELGDAFDPYSYQDKVDTSFNDFFSSLGDNLRAAVPTDLFSTSGLAGVAGAAQGGQNTVYDPNALAGIFDEEDEETNSGTPASPF